MHGGVPIFALCLAPVILRAAHKLAMRRVPCARRSAGDGIVRLRRAPAFNLGLVCVGDDWLRPSVSQRWPTLAQRTG